VPESVVSAKEDSAAGWRPIDRRFQSDERALSLPLSICARNTLPSASSIGGFTTVKRWSGKAKGKKMKGKKTVCIWRSPALMSRAGG